MKNLIGFLIFVAIAGHLAWKHYHQHAAPDGMSQTELRTLAASVRADEVVMYTTTECGYCHQAKNWLQANGFAFTECNMSIDMHCQSEFRAYGADGTPFLVIKRGRKEHHMKDGFDSDELVAALRA
jgi:glutaredoxin